MDIGAHADALPVDSASVTSHVPVVFAALALLGAGAACTKGGVGPPPEPEAIVIPVRSAPREPSLPAGRLQAVSLSDVMPVLAPFIPDLPVRFRVIWQFSRDSRVRGRGTVVIVPPDTMRFDFRAPFGRRGGVGIVANQVVWSEPETVGRQLGDAVVLVWAALGIPRTVGDSVYHAREPSRDVVQFVTGDTSVTYTVSDAPAPRLTAVLQREHRVIGSAALRFDGDTAWVAVGRMRHLLRDVGLSFAIRAIDSAVTLEPGWFRAPVR